MAQDPKLTHQRLDEIWKNRDIPVLQIKGNKFILLSDLHLGDGGKADDFRDNKDTLLAALTHYKDEGYKLLLLGDIEEFWQFALIEIETKYGETVYKAIKDFNDSNIFRIFGNHDGDWCIQPDPAKNEFFKALQATEAIKLQDEEGPSRILLVHGHQGDIQSDRDSWSSRFWVRAYRLVEPLAKKLGIVRAPAMKCETIREYERIMYLWAKKTRVILICGHSHNAIFASRSYADRLREKICALEASIKNNAGNKELIKKDKEEIAELSKKIDRENKFKRDILPADDPSSVLPCYFNTGCGIYEDGITGIEISNGEIRLAKWHRELGGARYEIYQRGSLTDFLNQI
jgi:UDP-2,3-diacylglucosamine pyrophosphatase LpxH